MKQVEFSYIGPMIPLLTNKALKLSRSVWLIDPLEPLAPLDHLDPIMYNVYPPTLQLILCLGWRLTSGVEMDDNSYVLLGADTSYLLPSTSDASYLLPSTSDASYILPSTSDTSYLFPSTSDTSYGSILLTSPRSIKNQGTQKKYIL